MCMIKLGLFLRSTCLKLVFCLILGYVIRECCSIITFIFLQPVTCDNWLSKLVRLLRYIILWNMSVFCSPVETTCALFRNACQPGVLLFVAELDGCYPMIVSNTGSINLYLEYRSAVTIYMQSKAMDVRSRRISNWWWYFSWIESHTRLLTRRENIYAHPSSRCLWSLNGKGRKGKEGAGGGTRSRRTRFVSRHATVSTKKLERCWDELVSTCFRSLIRLDRNEQGRVDAQGQLHCTPWGVRPCHSEDRGRHSVAVGYV